MPGTFLGESRRTSSNGTLKRVEMTRPRPRQRQRPTLPSLQQLRPRAPRAPLDPGQLPQPLRSHPPALQWPSLGCGSAPLPAYRYWRRSSSNFSCVTNYREPVSRIISCLAYRHPTEMRDKCVADMDVGLLRVLLNRPDRFGNSCLNEPFPDNVRDTVGSFHRQAR